MNQTIHMRVLLLFGLLLLTGVLQAADTTEKEQGKRPYVLGIPVFQNEKALKDWIRERLPSSKLVDLEREGRRVCIVFEPVGFGQITTTIYIFIAERSSGNWGIATVWQTYTSEVRVVPPKGGKELTFKSKSGKTLFRVPFEALEPKNDSDY